MYKNTSNKRGYQDIDTFWDIHHLIDVVRDKSRVVVIVTLICLLAGGLYSAFAPRIYSSSAVLMVDQRAKRVVDIQDVNQEDLEAMDVMKTIEQSLTTDQILLAVIHDNHLDSNPDFLPPSLTGDSYTDDQLIKALAKDVNVKIRRGTRLIDITAKCKNPVLAKRIADSLVAEYLSTSAAMRGSSTKSAYEFLTQEADRLKTKLQASEQQLEDYREKNDALSLEEKQNIVNDTLKAVNTQLNDARNDRIRLASDMAQYKALGQSNPAALLSIGSIANSTDVLDAKKRLADQQEAVATVSQRYRSEHPRYIEAQSELRECQATLDKAVIKAGENIAAAYQAAQTNESLLEDALREQEKVAFALSKIAVPYAMLLRDVDADRDMYQSVITRLKETDITKSLEAPPIQVIEQPRIASKPIWPKPILVMSLALFAGMTCGFALALLAHSVDGTIHTVEDAEQAFAVPVIAALPKGRRKSGKTEALPLLNKPGSTAAEAFRSLRTVLELKEVTDKQVIVFTSALPEEGKSFCSMNCAVSLAHQGYKTLLIDADLRRPTIGKVMKVKPDAPGLTDYLTRGIQISSAIQPSLVEHLFILPAGQVAGNPAELLAGAAMHEILKNPLLAGYDRFVIDTAPLNAVSDSLYLLRHATATCLVIRSGMTPAAAIQRALKAISGAKAKDVGLILNEIERQYFSRYSTPYSAEGVYGQSQA